MEIDLTDLIIEYENGNTNLTQEILLFAKLVETGQAWTLQGHYGRVAMEMIDLEFISKDGKVLQLPVEEE
tara:strand:- start:1933 stop:2142 length:210 start_codon:yes stop_codon:yes gene_type:complete